jgi:membrane peptidoglycan carboxypeptidase
MISSILSDPKAKLFTYGRNTPLVFGDRPVASKTGTTDNYRDTWTDGYTPSLAMVVWVGNTNGEPMGQALSSMTAGKIWPQAMQVSWDMLDLPPADFPRPDGLVDGQVCGDTALRPGEPACRNDLFFAGQAPRVEPTAVATTAPTQAPEPTAAAEPTGVPEPTVVPRATGVPEPTGVPKPTGVTKPQATSPPAPTNVAARPTSPTQPTPAPTARATAPAAQPTAAKPAPTPPPGKPTTAPATKP